MKKLYTEHTAAELNEILAAEHTKLDRWSDMNLTLDLTRGKPSQMQLDLSSDMLGAATASRNRVWTAGTTGFWTVCRKRSGCSVSYTGSRRRSF